RDVLASCLYAVDLNPMAVELCKVSLWINAVVEDERLNFLDHHIKCGNSLVGAFRRLVRQGIPSEAYGGATGDDKALVKAARNRNDQERRGQLSAFRVTELKGLADLRAWADLNRLAQEDPAKAEQRYRELQAKSEESAEWLAFDLWTAAFFWPLEEEAGSKQIDVKAGIQARKGERRTLQPPTTQDVSQALAAPELLDSSLKDYTRKLREGHRFFHWELEFPEIYGSDAASGFDVVLGNPPWERVKLQEKEFFIGVNPDIANISNAKVRSEAIAALRKGNPLIWDSYLNTLRTAEYTSKFISKSERYQLTGKGDINTFSVFAELDSILVAPLGRVGVIVPSGIATDFINKDFFGDLVVNGRLVSLYDFENRRKLFPTVDSRMKFSLLTFSGSTVIIHKDKVGSSDFAFFLLSVDDISLVDRHFSLSASDFILLNPNTRTCPVFRNKTDADLIRKIRRLVPILVDENTGNNPWATEIYRLLDMNHYASIIQTEPEMVNRGFTKTGEMNFKKNGEKWVRIYEGKMMDFYNHRFASGYTVESGQRSGRADTTNNEELADCSFTVNSRSWFPLKEVKFRMQNWPYDWFLAYMNICSPTNIRTMIPAFIPISAPTYSLRILKNTNQNAPKLACMLANLASLPFDYIVRQSVAGVNLSEYIVNQLPILSPNTYDDVLLSRIVPDVIELTFTSWDMLSFANDIWNESDNKQRAVIIRQWDENATATSGGHADAKRPEWISTAKLDGFPRPPFKWDDERRVHLRAELDGLYAHLYGLTRDEFAYILDTFPIVRRKDEAKYTEFRTKRLCLEAYDRLVGSDLIPPEARALQRESVLQAGDKGFRDRGAGEKAAEDSVPQDGAGKSEIRVPQPVDRASVVETKGQKSGAGGSQTVGEKPRSETSDAKTEGRTTGEKRDAPG
ncbi:MAG TPA: hypothetical protein PKD55_17760, partial [Bellilinea sp.]|nr:hypothetical protein [Bellilinea sp.]